TLRYPRRSRAVSSEQRSRAVVGAVGSPRVPIGDRRARGPARQRGRPGARRHGCRGKPREGDRGRLRGGRRHFVRRHALSNGHRAPADGAQRRAWDGAGGEETVTGPVRVGIVLGSDSDLEVMLETVKVLDALDVGSEVVVASAHRTPERTQEYASTAHARGIGVLIAGAGGAAALPGVLASFSP